MLFGQKVELWWWETYQWRQLWESCENAWTMMFGKLTLLDVNWMFFVCLLRVELHREAGKSLGISIVGGRGMGSRLSNGEVMRGIFIKHILEDSPAGHNGTLKTGDRILEVHTHTLSCLL